MQPTMRPIDQILAENGGRFGVIHGVKGGFKLYFDNWRVWIPVSFGLWLLGLTWVVMMAISIFKFFEDQPALIAGDYGEFSSWDIWLSSPILPAQLLLGGVVAILIQPFLYNLAYHTLMKERVSWSDLSSGISYGRVLLAVFIYMLITSVVSLVPYVSMLLALAVSPFIVLLAFAAVEGRSLMTAVNLGKQYYLPLLGLAIISSLLGFAGMLVFPLLFVGISVTAVIYGMARHEEEYAVRAMEI
ncbi:MAG: hypothetical protein Q3972_03595 [Corynebacterium sp.]|nr:hypothetical protein [Corynebacterium sp.]